MKLADLQENKLAALSGLFDDNPIQEITPIEAHINTIKKLFSKNGLPINAGERLYREGLIVTIEKSGYISDDKASALRLRYELDENNPTSMSFIFEAPFVLWYFLKLRNERPELNNVSESNKALDQVRIKLLPYARKEISDITNLNIQDKNLEILQFFNSFVKTIEDCIILLINSQSLSKLYVDLLNHLSEQLNQLGSSVNKIKLSYYDLNVQYIQQTKDRSKRR